MAECLRSTLLGDRKRALILFLINYNWIWSAFAAGSNSLQQLLSFSFFSCRPAFEYQRREQSHKVNLKTFDAEHTSRYLEINKAKNVFFQHNFIYYN